MLDLMRRPGGKGRNGGSGADRQRWPEAGDQAVLVVPLVARNEQLGVICCLARDREFTDEDAELLGAVANQTAVGLKKAELIERLTAENIVKDMFDALAAGSIEAGQAKASQARCDLSGHHLFLHVERAPERTAPQPPGPSWRCGSRRGCGARTREPSSTPVTTGCGRWRRCRARTAGRPRRCARRASRSLARRD